MRVFPFAAALEYRLGVKKRKAYKLLASGRVETFVLGRRRYITEDALRSLEMRYRTNLRLGVDALCRQIMGKEFEGRIAELVKFRRGMRLFN